jgi:hypothetical protein
MGDPMQRSDERGFAMVITVLVIMIASALALALIAMADSGLRQSRRSGNSANALQVADAGVNAAVKQLTDYTGASPLVLDSGLSGTGDTYHVVATKESKKLWHLDVVGTDSRGQSRHIKADAAAGQLFADAVFASTSVNFGSGVAVDSYTSGLSQAATCNGRGFVGSNDPANNDLNVNGKGNGVRNCTGQISGFTPSSGYVYDGCVGYADSEPVPHFMNELNNATDHTCGSIAYRTPSFATDQVDIPSGVGVIVDGSLNCTTALNLAPGKYVYDNITLGNGCRIPSSAATQDNPVLIYVKAGGAVNIGTGNSSVVNSPPPPPANCGGLVATSGSDYYGGGDASPLWYYCTGWPGQLQINVQGSGSVDFANHATFWGVIYAPQRTLKGGPHNVMFGQFTGTSVDNGAQLSFHFDEGLLGLTNGKFVAANWREEAL